MEAYVLKCRPGSRFHFGRYAPDSNTALSSTSVIPHSDTLFSALVNTYNDLFPDTDKFVAHFERGDLLISSGCFCLEQAGKFTWFLPKPVSFNLTDTEDHKSFKRIRFISLGLWNSLDKPGDLLDEKVRIVQQELALLESELVGLDDYDWKQLRLYHSLTLPKVQVRKPTQEGSLYSLNVVEIAEPEGLDLDIHYYFLLKRSDAFRESPQASNLDAAIALLAYNGIGAERATIGALEGIDGPLAWNTGLPENDWHCSLSLIHPREGDIPLLGYYQSLFRGGRRVGRTYADENLDKEKRTYLKSLRMIAEGAVVSEEVQGNVADIAPEDMPGAKFKRNGRALTIPMKQSWIPDALR